jgi:5-methylcytosine-specific restriction enzyme A
MKRQTRSAQERPLAAHGCGSAPGGEAYPPLERLRSQCASCHNRKTRIVEQLGEELTVKGCDIYGYPLDPNHPWYQGSPLRDGRR